MTKPELLEELARCAKCAVRNGDTEMAHMDADSALITFLNDPEITAAWHAIDKWYA